MSVKIVNIKHINELANAIQDRGLGDRRIIGQALHNANVDAYNFRYGDTVLPEVYRPRASRHVWHPAEVLRMVAALEYQCADQHAGWKGSVADTALTRLGAALAWEAEAAGPAPESHLWEYRGGTPQDYWGPHPAMLGPRARRRSPGVAA